MSTLSLMNNHHQSSQRPTLTKSNSTSRLLNNQNYLNLKQQECHTTTNATSSRAMQNNNNSNNSNLTVPPCNFESFSFHFDLPLKAAAEKFGVRATAFKKRCRAIGIRHWPYRKVRSLKRSLNELNQCRNDTGGNLNEKQRYQYNTFQKQLDRLMSPQTYGIDPSTGQNKNLLNQNASNTIMMLMNGNDDTESSADEDLYSLDSPQSEESVNYGNHSFSSSLTSISPTELPTERLTTSVNSFQIPQLAPLSSLKTTSAFSQHANSMPRIPGFPLKLSPHNILGGNSSLTTTKASASVEYEDSTGSSFSKMQDCIKYPSSTSSYVEIENAKSDDEGSKPLCEVDDFNEALQQIEYGNEKFFDDLFVELSPVFDCKV